VKRTLVEFAAWSVCETDDGEWSDKRGPEVYAEHFRDCQEDTDPDASSWSWEFDDKPDNGRNICWKCGGEVPEEVVALIQLHNWGRKRREE